MGILNRTIAFTGGGTAGHVFPAFPVIDRVRDAGFDVFWIGSTGGMERRLVENAGIRFYGIPSGKFRRYKSWKNLTDLFRIGAGLVGAFRVLRRERPFVLMSKGGFVSVPPVAAARLLRIPAFTHESDADPGLATRLNLALGARALVAYERTLDDLPPARRRRAEVVGNPVRDQIFAGNRETGRRIAGLEPADTRPLILVLGGSQGAREVNDLVDGMLDGLESGAMVVHQTGEGNPARPDGKGYLSRPFFQDELPHLLAAADLAVARSGAGTVWELAASGVPAVFIPLRDATRGDQILNAELAVRSGFAVTLPAGSDSPALGSIVLELISDPERRSVMKHAATTYPVRHSADRIASILQDGYR